MNTSTRFTTRLGLLAGAALLALTGCAAAPAAEAQPTAGEMVTISDAWAKAADEGMSAAFGELVNAGDQDVTVVAATSEAATMVELHETVENEAGEMVMREIEGGFVLPAGGTMSLAPGGNHLMMMELVEPLQAGQEISFTLTFSDGSSYEFTAPVKDYSGANENYVGDDSEMDMGED